MIKKLAIIIIASFLFCMTATAKIKSAEVSKNNCFVYKIGEKIVTEGACKKRHQPQSTFKIAISLMGYDAGILTDETHPNVPFSKGDADDLEVWKQNYTPALWMKNSCVWYSRFVTKELGNQKFKNYVKDFNYGNQNVSGDKGKDNGLTNSWISSSLQISPIEQVQFIEKILESKLPVTENAQFLTRNILYLQDLSNGYKLYGKTGTGDLLNNDGSHDTTQERGWFVGWIEKSDKKIIFAQYLEMKNEKTADNSFGYIASKQAKQNAITKLLQF